MKCGEIWIYHREAWGKYRPHEHLWAKIQAIAGNKVLILAPLGSRWPMGTWVNRDKLGPMGERCAICKKRVSVLQQWKASSEAIYE